MMLDARTAEQLADVRKDMESARTLPSLAYYHPQWFALEKANLFLRSWLLAGRAEQIPNIGDFFTISVAGESVLITRGSDRRIRAFSPSCRHRGTIIAEGKGNVRVFVCPYHRWTYSLEGELIGAPDMKQCQNFDRKNFSLVDIKCEEWQGFLFVNLSPGVVPSLLEQLGDLPEHVAQYRIGDMRFARERRYLLNCNWKSYMDNSVEAYHVSSVHGQSLEPVAPMSIWESEVRDGYYLLWADFAGTLGVLKGENGFPPIPGLRLDQTERHTLAIMLPNTVVSLTVDAMWWVTLMPIDAERTEVIVCHAFQESARALADYEEIAERYFKRFDLVNKEDNDIVEIQHRGILQSLRRPGPYAPKENLLHAFAQYVTDTVAPE